jgi:dTDP-4-dehydrorhamnose reductase
VILVTGGNGQLASCLKDRFPEYRYLSSTEFNLCDQASMESILSTIPKNSIIINAAAYTAVDKAEDEREQALKVNASGVRDLALLCLEYGHKIIHISTDYVFDGRLNRPYNENDEVATIGVYGETKLIGEMALAECLEDFVIVRTSWLYSEHGNNFLKTMLRLKDKETLSVVFDQVGTPTYAGDLAQIISVIVSQFEAVKGQVFHYSNEGAISWYDFACEIMQQTGASCKIVPIESFEYPTKTKRPHYSVFNKAKIKKALNITIPHWKESLSVCLKKIS